MEDQRRLVRDPSSRAARPRTSDGSAVRSGGANSPARKRKPAGGGDHSRVVGRQRQRGKRDPQTAPPRLCREALAQFAICRHPAGDHGDPFGIDGLGGCKGLFHQVADDGMLKAGDEVERALGTQVGAASSSFVFGGRPAASILGTRADASSRIACNST